MKNIITLSVFVVFTLIAFSQPAIEWQKCYGGTSSEEASWVQQTSDGGYVVTGTTRSGNGDVSGFHGVGGSDYWVIKIDNDSNLQWQKCLGGSSTEFGNSGVQTSDGGYMIAGAAGSMNDGDITDFRGSWDYWVAKLSSNGVLQWQQSLGSSLDDRAYAVQQTTDGGYIIAGFASYNNGDVTDNHGARDFWIVKLYHDGIIQWKKSYGGTNDDWAWDVKQTVDGGYIFAGQTGSNDGDVTGNHGSNDYWVVKVDADGNLQWQKCYGGSYVDWAYSIDLANDGGYIIAGSSQSADQDVTGHHGTLSTKDCWIVKIDSVGTVQWQKSLGGSYDEVALSVRHTSEGGYITAGYSFSNDFDVTGHHGTTSYSDYWITKLDNNGNLLWQMSLGGGGDDEAHSIQQTTDGGFIVAGYASFPYNGDITAPSNHNGGGDEYWIVKLTPYVGVDEAGPQKNSVALSPNPATNELSVSCGQWALRQIEIYDVLGNKIYSRQPEAINPQPVIISIDDFPSGIYFVKVRGEKEERIMKFIKR